VASLGLAARNSAGLKVRQPLARALAYAGGRQNLRPELVEIVTDELNVKQFEFVEKANQLVNYQVLPDNKALGPRFGADFPKVRQALQAADPNAVAASVAAGVPFALQMEGQVVELAPQEILIQTHPAEGLAVASGGYKTSDKQVTVAVDSKITPELRAEGLAREVVRRIQAMRKEAGFDISDRISTTYKASGEFTQVFRDWAEYIQSETLSTELIAAEDILGEPPAGAYQETQQVEGQSITLSVKRNA